MKIIIRTLNVLFILSILTIAHSCNGQNASQNANQSSDRTIGDTVKALGDSLWYIYQDKKNNYWFGSDGEGVYRYDGKTILNFTTKNGLCSDSIRQIQEDKLGNMYFSTLGGINKFDGKKITTLQPIENKEWKSEANDMWFYMLGKKNENGPYRYDGQTLYHLAFPKHYLHDEFYAQGINPFFSPYEIYTIYKDRKGSVWFGTAIFGACRFDGKSLSWLYEKDLTETPHGGSFGIRSVFEDPKGRFWFCNTWHRYLIQPDDAVENGKIKYKKIEGIGNAKTFGGDEYIYYSHIVEDNKGDIWLTTWDQGVFKYDGTHITHYPVKNGSKNINLVSMYKDNKGDLWLGTTENGVYKFNGNTFEKFKP